MGINTQPSGATSLSQVINGPDASLDVEYRTDPVTGVSAISGDAAGAVAAEVYMLDKSESDVRVVNNFNGTNNGAGIANGSNLVNSVVDTFLPGDEGKLITVCSATGNVFYRSVIAQVISAKQVQCVATHAGATIGAGTGSLAYGTDRLTKIQAALSRMEEFGGTLYLPIGGVTISNRLNVPNGVWVEGRGIDYGRMEQFPSRGSSIMLLGPAPGVAQAAVRVGVFGTQNQTDSGTVTGGLKNLNVDAAQGMGSAVETYGRRVRVEGIRASRGSAQAVSWLAQNGWARGNIFGQDNVGDVFVCAATDVKIDDNEMRQAGTGHQVKLINPVNNMVRRNHFWKGAPPTGQLSASQPGSNVYVDVQTSGCKVVQIVSNSFDGTYGSHIQLNVAAGQTLEGVGIGGSNTFFHTPGFPDNTFPVIGMSVGAGGAVDGLSVSGCVGKALDSTHRYKAFMELTGAGSVTRDQITGNAVSQCVANFVGFAPSTLADNV